MTAHFVYRCYAADGRLLYVGQTKDWTQRLETHRRTSFWAAQVVRVKVKAHRSPEAARAAEKKAIQTEDPRFNLQGRWQVRSIWGKQAWLDYVRTATAGRHHHRRHIEEVFAAYGAVFNEPHPMAQPIRLAWAESDRVVAVDTARRHAQWDAERRALDAADHLSMLGHLDVCRTCALAGGYAEDCPDTLADIARLETEGLA